MRFIIARHGETDFNIEGRLSGSSNRPKLTDNGKRQANNLIGLVKDLPSDYFPIMKVYSSTLLRAKDPAKQLAHYLKVSHYIDARLKEMDFGDLEGKTMEERAPFWEERKNDKLNFRPPNGESYADLIQRARSFTEKFDTSNDWCFMIVAHESINRCVIGNLLGIPDHDFVYIRQPNTVAYFLDTMTKDHFSIDMLTKERRAGWYKEAASPQTRS